MTITAKIIADSVSPQGIRLTTMQLRYPKFIHGEFMTHRVFSRNASSSRAIPVGRLIQDVMDDPAMPVFWGKNQKGMQAVEELVGQDRDVAIANWLKARDEAVGSAITLMSCGAHKQIVNRIIEPWCHINVVVTATDWANFFALRRHKDAQPEMKALADAMWEAREASWPKSLSYGEWHLPYCSDIHSLTAPSAGDLIRVSVARCARVSYLTHEGKSPNVEDDLKLYERLVGSVPLHASPAEHQAMPDEWGHKVGAPNKNGGQPTVFPEKHWRYTNQHGNFTGWRQHRKMLINENISDR